MRLFISLFWLSALCLLLHSSALLGQSTQNITVVSYNILNFPNPNNSNPLGNDAVRASYFRQIVESADADVVIIQEMKSITGAILLVNELNNNGTLGKTYSYATNYVGYPDLGNMLIYNDDVLNLISQQELPRNNTANAPNGNTVISPRGTTHYEVEIQSVNCGQNVTVPMDLFSLHLKAGDDSASGNEISDRDRRNLGVLDAMDFINALPSSANVILGGDMNFQDENVSSEPGYGSFTNNSNAQPLVDVIGPWTRNNAGFVEVFTQATRGGSSGFNLYGNGGAPGGLDDRFDFLFISNSIQTGSNDIDYVSNSYETFGNPLILNGDATDGTFFLEDQLKQMSDHYPVIMELEVSFPTANISCDDGNPCTVSDSLDTNCNCVGILLDADGDGVCDSNDLCPNIDDNLIGTACNDGNFCTINDVYDNTCQCIGTFADSDGDGVCDAQDVCANFDDNLINTPCNDGDPCTISDEYDDNCQCVGIFIDSDGDGVCDAQDVCPSLDDTLIGTACNDGNFCTTNDVYNTACNCVGTFVDSDGDGVCDAQDVCANFDDNLINTPCNDGDPCTITDEYDDNCQCVGVFIDSDGDGVCDAQDVCPSLNDNLIGTACNDGDFCTTNDVYDTACNCVGTFVDSDGDGVCDAQDVCSNFDDNLINTPCDDGDPCTIGDEYNANCECTGFLEDSDNDGICDMADSCPFLDNSLIGTACDDGDICTINDVYEAICECMGTYTDSDSDGVCDTEDVCANLNDNLLNTPCDDGDPTTENDQWTTNCTCEGSPIDNSCVLEIPLQAGWNLISSYCDPINPDIEVVFNGVVGNLVQVKNLTDTYVPTFAFNSIGNWDITSGYQVKMTQADTLVINGTRVDPLTTPIYLEQGWNLGAYLLDTISDPFMIWAEISPNVIQIKDLTGTYIPSFNFSDIGTLYPTQGFQFKMAIDDTLIYDPANAW